MNSFNSSLAPKWAIDGFLLSPHDADVLERRCSENVGDWEARWKLLGFYFAHQLCCHENRSRRIENIIWTIDNVPQIPPEMRSYLLLLTPGDRLYTPRSEE